MIFYLYPVTLSIIIVNYNVKRLLEQCLSSVLKALARIDGEIHVVDNASTDDSITFLQPLFPQVQFSRNEKNVGFSRANNQALQRCTGKYVLFLNPDTIVPPDCFDKCIAFFDQHQDAGALGVRMIDGEGNFLRESKRGLPTPMASLWKLSGVTALFPKSRVFASYYEGHKDEHTTQKVDVLSGAFMMVRKDVLDKTGGFDERFFMYAEDIDLSYRILRAGYNNYYFADTTITHLKGSSTTKDTRYVRMFYKAMSQYVKKWYGNGPFSWILDAGIFLRGSVAAISQFFARRR